MKNKLSPRGALEFFENNASVSSQFRYSPRTLKWKHFYSADAKGLKTALKKSFPELEKMEDTEAKEFVGNVFNETYANPSSFHHTFDAQQVC